MNAELKSCQHCKQKFEIAPEDFLFYEKIKVPPPTWCSECRMIRRMLFRNQRFLYRRKEDQDGREILAMFPPRAPVRVFTFDYWNSDNWEPLEYGKDYNFSRTFFEQFRELFERVPLPAQSVSRMINSDYCNNAGDVKNGYLCFEGDRIEDSAYIVGSYGVKDSFDCYDSRSVEQCYESLEVDDSSRVFFSFDCGQCSDVWFSKDLSGCTNCFGCANLRNRHYYIFNVPHTKEEYFEKIKKFNPGSYAAHMHLWERARNEWLQYPVKFMHGSKNVNVSGEHIQQSRNVRESYTIHGGENLKYCQQVADKVEDSYDYAIWGASVSLMYETIVSGEQCSEIKFSLDCWPGSRNLEYCISCRSSADCFGCVGLKKKQYCIFNKQYTKEEYYELRERIIMHTNEMPYHDAEGRIYRYGEFFPLEFSPFSYNETIASDYFPMVREEVVARGLTWRETESREYAITLPSSQIPDLINDVSDAIIREIIGCESCGRAYRVIASEILFCKKNNIPLPRKCGECRFKNRFALVNPPKFWHGKCRCAGGADDRGIYQNEVEHFHGSGHCPNEFETSYAPGRLEIVYCEECYTTEVVG